MYAYCYFTGPFSGVYFLMSTIYNGLTYICDDLFGEFKEFAKFSLEL